MLAYGAINQKVSKNEMIFLEGSEPHYFFQVLEGEVKMISLNQDGKELIQGIFKSGQCFGEPPLFVDKPYPSSAVAIVDSIILKMSKKNLLALLDDKPSIAIKLLEIFALRIYNKALSAQILSNNNPEEKILGFLNMVKGDMGVENQTKIPYTRQQIADSTGLCVETVIRTLLKLNNEHKVEIKHHKIYY
ncbi:MAG: Crp/Fnr family transcriptional regulator [Crocinitomicaceae bacterium]